MFGSDHVYSISPNQHYVFERYNDKFQKDELALTKLLHEFPGGNNISQWRWKRILKKRKRMLLKNEKMKMLQSENDADAGVISSSPQDSSSLSSSVLPSGKKYDRTVIVLEFNPDKSKNNDDSSSSPTRSAVEQLRDTITFILHSYRHNPTIRSSLSSINDNINDNEENNNTHQEELEIVILLESPGGSVQEYGLASDQIQRLRSEPGITLTICVDRVAASGGYMMACRSSPDKLIAAPFAVLGSIGVLREALNVHDLLEKQGVQPLIFQAGKDKVPITTFGKITQDGMKRVQSDLDRVHDAFKSVVTDARPQIAPNTDIVCTGDVFMGHRALELGLCDAIMTSDEYFMDCMKRGDRVLKLHRYDRSKFGLKLSPLDLFLLRGLGGGGGGLQEGGFGGNGLGGILFGLLQRMVKGGNGILKQASLASSSSPLLKVGYTVAMMKLLNSFGGEKTSSSPSFFYGGNDIM